MSRKGKKNPPDSRQEEAGSPAAGTRKVPKESLASRGREAAATARSFGPRDWLFAAALVVAVFLVYQPAWSGGFVWDDENVTVKESPRSLASPTPLPDEAVGPTKPREQA
jgi:hypothetical protein